MVDNNALKKDAGDHSTPRHNKSCALTATFEKIRNRDCFRVLDTDQKSAHYFWMVELYENCVRIMLMDR